MTTYYEPCAINIQHAKTNTQIETYGLPVALVKNLQHALHKL